MSAIVFSVKRAKPTPGPWRIGAIKNCTDGFADSLAVWPEKIVKAKARGSPICLCSAIEKATLEDEANAHLIAAAPDLLDSCRELCKRLEDNELVNRPNTYGNHYDQPAYDRAQTAIAKATGEGR